MIPYAMTAAIGAMLWLLVGGLGVPPLFSGWPGGGGIIGQMCVGEGGMMIAI
jgi:hypothetical protein